MHPVLIDVFGLFKIHTYGLMIALGFLIGMQIAVREARRVDTSNRNYDQFVLDLCFWILVSAMIGSRIVFIIVEWDTDYANDPMKIFRIWEGGLVFYGGLLGAMFFSIYYTWKKGWNFLFVADTLIPSVALGQFFGRMGCLAAGCCWGDPAGTDAHFAIQFPPGALAYNSMVNTGVISPDALATIHVHPVQMYESMGALMIFIILVLLRTQKRFHGMVLCGYMFLYPVLRYINEEFRGDAARGENMMGTTFSTSQLISLALFSTALAIMAYKLIGKKFTPARIEDSSSG